MAALAAGAEAIRAERMLTVLLIGVLAIALSGGLYWLWRRRVDAEVAEGAAYEWALLSKNEPELVAGLDEARFRAIYAQVHTPRFPAYALGAVATFLATLPLTLAALSMIQWAAAKAGLTPEPYEIVRYVHLGQFTEPQTGQCNQECQLQIAESFSGFYYFFGVLIAWLAVVYVFTRRFHARRPGYLRDELIRARQ